VKAIVYEKYGSADVLELREIDKPAVPDGSMLVRVRAASANPVDWYTMTGRPYLMRLQDGLRKPKDTGLRTDFAGTVEAVGGNVSRFRPGDEVFGRAGAFAEYVCLSEDGAVVAKPANLTFEQAAAVPVAAITALQGLRDKGQLEAGQKVVINGASGGVGTFAVQIAKALGAEVTGVCSTRNVELVRSLGADHVVDYTRDDFTLSGQRYDLMLDSAGSRSWSDCKRVLADKATLVLVGASKGNRLLGPLSHIVKVRLAAAARRSSQKVVFLVANMNQADLLVLHDLLEAGKVRPVIDRQYELSEISEALAYLGAGHAQGKVVISV
jgi:NADPH:quinone reductase-like Zn-dependent oxidoreductase